MFNHNETVVTENMTALYSTLQYKNNKCTWTPQDMIIYIEENKNISFSRASIL